MVDVALACLPAAFALIYVPRLVVAYGQSKMPEGLDNKHPRAQQARLTGWALRANGAHQNAFEAFAPFAAAVLAAHVAGADRPQAAAFAVAHVALRAAYTALYVADVDKLRTVTWLLATGATFRLFLLAL
jgi:uncharacterized MAPEG superfamily protein